VPVHHRVHDGGGARRRGLVHHGVLAAEHPVVAGAALDPYSGFVRGHHLGTAQRRDGRLPPGLEPTLGAAEQVHQPALAEAQPEQVGERGLQPLVGERLEGLEVDGHRV